jgi:hypothetical protein
VELEIYTSRLSTDHVPYVVVVGTSIRKVDPHFARCLVRACLSALPAVVDDAVLDELARQLANRPEIAALAERARRSPVPIRHVVNVEYLAYLLTVAKPAKWVLRYHTARGWIEQYHSNESVARQALQDQLALAVLEGWESPSLCSTSGL